MVGIHWLRYPPLAQQMHAGDSLTRQPKLLAQFGRRLKQPLMLAVGPNINGGLEQGAVMDVPNSLRFVLLNGVSERDVNASKFIVYAHVCKGGTYVGLSENPVGRWQQHCHDAVNEGSKYYNDDFKAAIRAWNSGFEHYVLAVANFEKAARNKEAAAIRYYEANLNMRSEYPESERDYGFRPISKQVGIPFVLDKRSGTSGSEGKGKAKTTITAEIVLDSGRKRVVCTPGQVFPAGLYVECSRAERDKFDVGDRVRVSVSLSEDGKYLVGRFSKFTRAE